MTEIMTDGHANSVHYIAGNWMFLRFMRTCHVFLSFEDDYLG